MKKVLLSAVVGMSLLAGASAFAAGGGGGDGGNRTQALSMQHRDLAVAAYNAKNTETERAVAETKAKQEAQGAQDTVASK